MTWRHLIVKNNQIIFLLRHNKRFDLNAEI